MKLFNFTTDDSAIELRCGLNQEELTAFVQYMHDYLKESFVESHNSRRIEETQIKASVLEIPVSMSELAQAASEYLDRELTPELGFLIGILLIEMKDDAGKIAISLIMEGKIQVDGLDLGQMG